MSETSLKPVIDKLENLFSKFNEKFYGGELQKAIITVSPDTTKGAYGWCTAWKAWSNQEPKTISDMKPEEIEAAKSEGFYEINICAEYLAPLNRFAKPSCMKWFTCTICKSGFRTQAAAELITIKNIKKPLNNMD